MANKPTPADFSPTVPDFPVIGQYQPIYGKFDLTTYIQGASDYEIMAFLVQCYNATLKGYSDVTQLSKDTVTAYNQLQTWVNTWFNNLDVQKEINDKLQEMYENGSLSAAVASSDVIIPAMARYLNSAEGTQNLSNVTATKIDSMAQDGSLADVVIQTNKIPDAVKQYLDSVDGTKNLSDVTAKKIEAMATDGSLGTVINNTGAVQNTTTNWLQHNVTPTGSAVVVDKSLTIEGAAADAKVTGSKIDLTKENIGLMLNRSQNLFNSLKFTNQIVYNYDGGEVTNEYWLLSEPIPTFNYKYISVRLIQNTVVSPVVFYSEAMAIVHVVQRSEFYKIDEGLYDSCYGFIKIPASAKYVKFSTYSDYKGPGMVKFYKDIPDEIIVSHSNDGDVFTLNEVIALHNTGDDINIVLMPGVYEEVVHFDNRFNVTIKGKSREGCIIVDKSGIYKNSTLVVFGNFLLENLTIKATIDNAGDWHPTFNDSDVNNTYPSYALHIDGRSLNTEEHAYGVVRNCLIYSTAFPAVGMGLNKNQTVTFENCDFVRMCTDDRYKKDTQRGAFLCHNSVEAGYVENQRLILNGCRFISNYGYSCHIRVNLDVDDSSKHFTLLAINNQFESSDLQGVDLCKYEKGNSVLDLMSGLNGSANINAYHNSKVAYDYDNIFNLPLNFTAGTLQNNGTSPSPGWVISPYLIPVPGSELKYYANTVNGAVQLFVFYDDNLNVLDGYAPKEPTWATGTYTIPNNSNIKYMRTCMNLSDGLNGYVGGKFKMQ